MHIKYEIYIAQEHAQSKMLAMEYIFFASWE